MPLPATIFPTHAWSNWKGNVIGPFEHTNGDLYVILYDTFNTTLEAWRSTDGGNTWAEADAANHPTSHNTGSTFHVTKDGSLLWSWIWLGTTSAAFRVFSMATNTWGSPRSALLDFSAAAYNGSKYVLIAGPRNGDSWTIVRQRATERVMGTDYFRIGADNYDDSSDTWFAATGPDLGTAGEQLHHLNAQLIRSGDRLHVFYQTANSPQALRHQSISNLNVAGTVQNIDTSLDLAQSYQIGIPCLNGTEVIVPFVDGDGALKVARATSADTPTWSIQTVSGTSTSDPDGTDTNPGALVAISGTVYAFWPDDTTQDIWTSNDQGTGTWTTPVEWKDAVTVTGINIAAVTGGIGVLYHDSTSLKYDLYSLGGGSTPITDDDTGTITAAHASTTAVTTARADSGTITGTGASTLAVDLPSSDSGTITATTASTLDVVLNSADSGTISASESSTLPVRGRVYWTEFEIPDAGATPKSSSDSGTLTSTEASTLFADIVDDDAGTIVSSEAATIAATITHTGSGTVTASTASTISADITSSDTGTITATENATTPTRARVYWAEFEIPTVGTPISSSDSGTLASTETSTLTAAITRSDSGTITAAEAPAVFATVVATDSGTISSTEDPAINTNEESKSSSDSGTLTATTASTLAVTAAATDSGTITAAHASTIDATIASTDSGTIAASESPSVSGSRSAETSDTGAITLIESSAIAVDHATADTGTLAVSAASVISSPVSSTDSGLVASSESAVVTSDASAADTGTITSTEDSTITADVLPSTTLSLSMSAASSISVSVASSDTGVLTAAHANALFAEVVNIDTGAITLVEVAEAEEVVFSGPLRATFTYEDLLDGALEVSATELTATFRSLDLLTATFTYEE